LSHISLAIGLVSTWLLPEAPSVENEDAARSFSMKKEAGSPAAVDIRRGRAVEGGDVAPGRLRLWSCRLLEQLRRAPNSERTWLNA